MTVTYRRIESTDPRLKRHVRHDDRSRAYAFDTSGLSIVSAKHTRRIPVLDQGQLGSCTGNAGIGCLGTDPFFSTLAQLATGGVIPAGTPFLVGESGPETLIPVDFGKLVPKSALAGSTRTRYSLDEAGAVALYSDATKADDYPGQYPPDDTGSDGLTIAKVLQKAGEISGYQHTFTLDDALKALGVTPFITGVNWYNNMFDPDQDGRVYPTGGVAGGHEFVADEIDAENKRVWFTNSWGDSWGVGGRFYMAFDDYAELLSQQGDVTIFTPLTKPAPTPVPPTPAPGDADRALAAALRHGNWINHPHIDGNHRVAVAGKAWLAAHPEL